MKDTLRAYLCLCVFGVCGGHRCYLRQYCCGLLYFFTGALATIGWWYDCIFMSKLVDKANNDIMKRRMERGGDKTDVEMGPPAFSESYDGRSFMRAPFTEGSALSPGARGSYGAIPSGPPAAEALPTPQPYAYASPKPARTYCSSCGQLTDVNARYCAGCGTSRIPMVTAAPTEAGSYYPPQPTQAGGAVPVPLAGPAFTEL